MGKALACALALAMACALAMRREGLGWIFASAWVLDLWVSTPEQQPQWTLACPVCYLIPLQWLPVFEPVTFQCRIPHHAINVVAALPHETNICEGGHTKAQFYVRKGLSFISAHLCAA